MYTPTEVEVERRKRIHLTVYAYAYEFWAHSLVTDEEFDKMCLEINTAVSTGSSALDTFFREVFNPHTGMWIHNHPDLVGVERVYTRYYKDRK